MEENNPQHLNLYGLAIYDLSIKEFTTFLIVAKDEQEAFDIVKSYAAKRNELGEPISEEWLTSEVEDITLITKTYETKPRVLQVF